jgi:hypothetical protein
MVSGRRTRKAASTVRPPGMYRAAEHRADDSAMGEADRIFTDELGWMFTRNQVREYGIDGHALVVRGDGLVTGRMLATQVKGGRVLVPPRDGRRDPFDGPPDSRFNRLIKRRFYNALRRSVWSGCGRSV